MNPGLEDDLLARSVRALRREQAFTVTPIVASGEHAGWGREHTWVRIAADVRRARTVRRWMSVAALQLALALCGATVWGAATGRLQPAARAAAAAVRGLVSPAPHAHSASRRTATLDGDVGRSDPRGPGAPAPILIAAAPPAVAPAAGPGPGGAPTRHIPRVAPPRPSPPAPPGPGATGAASDRATLLGGEPPADTHLMLALYREAHRLHFVERDYAQALGAWDRYLAAGSGPLVLEARYNRAIALAHLGRREEAIAALRPFADGQGGGYRRQEALALIEALRGGADSRSRDP